MERVNAFQGQSPLYYLLVWLFVHLIGESEFTLRLYPSFWELAPSTEFTYWGIFCTEGMRV